MTVELILFGTRNNYYVSQNNNKCMAAIKIRACREQNIIVISQQVYNRSYQHYLLLCSSLAIEYAFTGNGYEDANPGYECPHTIFGFDGAQ
jgi:hypothetical protein